MTAEKNPFIITDAERLTAVREYASLLQPQCFKSNVFEAMFRTQIDLVPEDMYNIFSAFIIASMCIGYAIAKLED